MYRNKSYLVWKNKNILLFFLMIFFPLSFIYGWGEKGHKLINKKAVEILPSEMSSFKAWENYISEHAADADIRKRTDSTEWNKHFIDLDYYKEFQHGKMIEDKEQLIKLYGDSTVSKIGILPWTTIETFNNLTKAFKEKNRDKILLYAADLGHYAADGHQPMHTVVNYDGQLSGQKGIHFRYEVTMLDRHLDKLQEAADSNEVKYVSNPLSFVFNYLENANSVCPLLFDADNYAFKITGSRESDDYYNMLWFRTKYITKIQIQAAELDVASLIYSAWIDSGKPSLNDIN